MNNNWLKKYDVSKVNKIASNQFCSYLIALEGWRRGLKLTFNNDKVTKSKLHSPGLKFILSSNETERTFYKSRSDKVKGQAFKIGSNKYATKKWLEEHEIPVAKGKRFKISSDIDDILNYADSLDYPVVVKPVVGAKGKGVFAGIEDRERLKEVIRYLIDKQNISNIIVEKHITGKEYRLYIIEDKVIAVINRIPANITGDGKHTIQELINQKNNLRKKNPRLKSCLINIDFEIKAKLKELQYTLETIPKKGELIYLRNKSNISTGGDSIELTEEFPEEIKKIAIKALKVVDDFPVGGVDIMYDHTKPIEEAAAVIELSPTPQIGSLVFPMEGQAIDVPAAIIDYYFPETINRKDKNNNMYFNMQRVLSPLQNSNAKEIVVAPCGQNENTQIKFIVEGKVQNVGYRKWVQKKAIEHNIHGYVQNQLNGTVVIGLLGEKECINEFKTLCKQGPRKSNVEKIIEKQWDEPIDVGFIIKKTPKQSMIQKVWRKVRFKETGK